MKCTPRRGAHVPIQDSRTLSLSLQTHSAQPTFSQVTHRMQNISVLFVTTSPSGTECERKNSSRFVISLTHYYCDAVLPLFNREPSNTCLEIPMRSFWIPLHCTNIEMTLKLLHARATQLLFNVIGKIFV